MILALLQARMSSSRLPGKVLKPILGRPMLLRQLERVQRARSIDKLIVVTSTDVIDDQLESLCKAEKIEVYRGSLDDVLDRFYQAARPYDAENIVRLTGDCPLSDPEVIDAVVAQHLREGNDYTSNTLQPTFPDGLDVEVFKSKCLQRAWEEARLPSQREHVTPYVWQRPERFTVGHVVQKEDLSFLRWTVDEPSDFDLVSCIYETIYPQNPEFKTRDILDLLEKLPKLKSVNAKYERNEGLERSLQNDSHALKGQQDE